MKIAEYAVSRPVAVTMQIAALVLLGIICLMRLPVDLLPSVSLPTIVVTTQWPNVAPEEIEAQVTRPIEQSVSSVPNLYQVSSTTSEGSSSVRIRFKWGTDIGQAAIDVMQLIQRAKRSFPSDDTLQDPVVGKFDPNSMPILTVGVSGEDDPVKLRTLLDNQISPMVESADGVASASVSGGQQRAIILDVDPVRLQAHHLALADIARRLMQENINLPAGVGRQSDTEYTVRCLGWLTSIDELKAIPLSAPAGQVVQLGAVADVRDDHRETRNYIRLNGRPAAGLTITKQSGANTITTVQSVMERLDRAKQMYPQLYFSVVSDQSKYVKNSMNDLKLNALIGGVLAILILLFFLRNIRSTLVVALSIPISIIATFALLYLCGFTLNTMSLGGLALATGLIVDDAVVVLENIFRHIERDKRSAREAAVTGTHEIMSAVIASTWTVMVVFLPLLLIRGMAGQMFTQFALVVIFSLAVSLFDAVTAVPMLSTLLISGEAHREAMTNGHTKQSLLLRLFARFGQWFAALDAGYRNGLGWALRHRWWTLGGAVAITLSACLLIPRIGYESMPKTDSSDFSGSVSMPTGTALEKTDAVMRKVEGILLNHPAVESVFSSTGTGRGFGGRSVSSQGSVTVHVKESQKESTEQVIADLRPQLMRLPGARVQLRASDIIGRMMSGGDTNLEIDIYGADLATLSKLAQDVQARIRDVPGLENLDVNWQEAMPEIQWKVDRQKAAQLGVTFADVANTINTATSGSTATFFQENGFQYPIIVQLPAVYRKTTMALAGLNITPSAGGASRPTIELSQVAQPSFANGPSQITRQDRQRYIAVTGTPQGRSIGEIQADVAKRLAGMPLGTGYYRDWGTDLKEQGQEFGGMYLAIILAIGLIYMLLAAQFESFAHPFTVLLSVPLAATGVILGLFLTGRSFSLTALIGVLMLVGIVVKNGILLVDYTNVLRKRGLERTEAVLTASPTRLRPILMTASAAILGMLPIALALGKGSEIQAPMATAVIGGLVTSTALTLFVVPVVYTALDDLAALFRKRG